MAVRIRIALRRPSSPRVVETSALVNSGFEVDVPQLVLPTALARELGFDIEGPLLRPSRSAEVRNSPCGSSGW